MDFSVTLSSFLLLFVAEMGDKTQLMAMTLAHRFRIGPVIAGAFAAFLVLNLLAVLVGEALAHWLPEDLVLVAAGLLFLAFAYRSWREGDGDGDAGEEDGGHRRAFVTSFVLILVAELGDKTQLAMVALAAKTGELWSVLVGGTLALWAVSLIGILLGGTLLRRLPKPLMHKAAALLFLGFGLAAVGQAAFGLWGSPAA